MKSGYDQHFKKAQKIAAQNSDLPHKASSQSKRRPQLNFRNTENESKILIDQLRNRTRPKPQKKVKKTIQWKFAGLSFLGLLLTGTAFLNIDKVEKGIRSIELTMMGSANASEPKSEPKPDDKAKAPAKPDDKGTVEQPKAKSEKPPENKEYSTEEINHFSKLNERKRELDAREEELNRMEQELAGKKLEIEKHLTELDASRKNISSVLQEKVQVDDKKIENLVQLYSTMKPQQAAKAFEDMDEGLAVEILGRMKKKNAAEIMNLVKSEKVKILSEKYAGYKRN